MFFTDCSFSSFVVNEETEKKHSQSKKTFIDTYVHTIYRQYRVGDSEEARKREKEFTAKLGTRDVRKCLALRHTCEQRDHLSFKF